MDIEKRDFLPLAVLLLAILGIGFVIGVLSNNKVVEKVNDTMLTDVTDEGCNSLNLRQTAECLKDELTQFYFYNISNAGKTLSIDELKESGGVCSHATSYFMSRIKELGFSSKTLTIETGNYTHIFAVMSNSDGWCALDQTNVRCVDLGDPYAK